MKEVRIRNNSEQQAEGKIPRLGRDNSGKAIELHHKIGAISKEQRSAVGLL